MILRRAILIVMVVSVVIAGCEKLFGDGYTWFKRGKSAASWSWTKANTTLMNGGGCHDFVACPMYQFDGGHCEVFSRYTLSEARTIKVNGRTVFEHEVGKLRDDGSIDPEGGVGHCAGYDHKERLARSVN